GFVGNDADRAHYAATARGYIGQWLTLAQDPGAAHLDLASGRRRPGAGGAAAGVDQSFVRT
ncbi:hypothetical protein, partial [Kitasatospora sp. NPDC093558]|uniref:hypothetical protein n=1 Tax=Kitasatospora sp. NPDC093558 TaxID=3155201 RepID=UPI003415C17D